MLKQKNLQVTASQAPITQEPDPAHYDQKGRQDAGGKILLPE